MAKFTYHNADGVRRTAITDSDNPGQLIVHTEVDMDQIIASNAVMRELRPHAAENGFRYLARGVPLTVYEKSLHEQWDEGDWDKWLNDPDNAVFRIWAGRVNHASD